jgi:L-asparaginase/Glu-tRNA(Gln) amidotransferase subunit D
LQRVGENGDAGPVHLFQKLVSGELSPQKARVLLMLGLTKTSEIKGLQHYFNDY